MSKNKTGASLKSQVILLICAPIIVIIICSLVIYFSVEKIEVTPSEAETTTADFVLSTPENTQSAEKDVKKLLSDVINADDVKIEFSQSTGVKIKQSDFPEKLEKLLSFAADKMGAALSDAFFAPSENKPSYGKNGVLIQPLYPSDNTPVTFEKTDDGRYSYLFSVLSDKTKSVDGNDKKMLAELVKSYAELLSASEWDFTVSDDGVLLCVTADPATGKADAVTEERTYTVSFVGNDTAPSFSAEIKSTKVFDITFAGIKIEQDSLRIHSNGYDNLKIIADVDENASQDEFSVVFVSSDPSVCTVDENGTVEAVRESDKPVTVKVTLSYLGKTYSDSCLVYVSDNKNAVIPAAAIGSSLHLIVKEAE